MGGGGGGWLVAYLLLLPRMTSLIPTAEHKIAASWSHFRDFQTSIFQRKLDDKPNINCKIIVLIEHNCFELAFLLLLLPSPSSPPFCCFVLFCDLSRLFLLLVVVSVLTQSPTNRVRDSLNRFGSPLNQIKLRPSGVSVQHSRRPQLSRKNQLSRAELRSRLERKQIVATVLSVWSVMKAGTLHARACEWHDGTRHEPISYLKSGRRQNCCGFVVVLPAPSTAILGGQLGLSL